ncbi:aldo/keto reductase [Allostreptomyces psammosilenae]|uniref:D-threo-aldose 1-dehydrogenase n=1 Tax=Allostreptomyces psammosilenae TaxID=1892865 RepID=A0A853A144_9ACTN|nr:aldo/keto reductase [Allostreptomyces psammosilenae]NYI04222.1 D-threo-aldose 1-dehydrogenase [Allostreptomyces psammosilenae]
MGHELPTRGVRGDGPALTELGFGGAPIGNLYQAVEEEQATAAVDAAWEAGIRYFDTAPYYGVGLAERRLGRALAGRDRASYVLSTKVGRVLEPDPDRVDRRGEHGFDVSTGLRPRFDFSRAGVLRSLTESLERLGLDRVDVVYLHDADDHLDQAAGEAFGVLAELRDQGVVRAIGAGMNSAAALTRLVRETDMDVVMLAGRYTLLEQGALDDLLPAAVERGTSVVVAGPFNSGLLSRPVPTAEQRYEYAAAPADLLARARRLAEVCERHGTTLPAAALAFPLGHPAVVSVCAGMRSPLEVRENAARARAGVPAELWAELKEEGLLRPDAPTPGG